MPQVSQTFPFTFNDTISDPGEQVPIPYDDFSALKVTNDSGQTISYSTNGGSTWTDLAAAGTLTVGYGLKKNYLFRKNTTGWATVKVEVTYPGSEVAQLKMVSGAVNAIHDPTGTKANGFAMLPVDANGKVAAAIASVAAADSAAAAAATATTIAAAVPADAAAATATTIAAAIPDEPPNVDEDGIAAGGFITRAARRTLVQAVIDLRTYAVEQKADFDKAVADIDDIRTKYNSLRAYAVEQKADFDKLVDDTADIRTKYGAAVTLANETKAQLNALLAELRAKNILAT